MTDSEQDKDVEDVIKSLDCVNIVCNFNVFKYADPTTSSISPSLFTDITDQRCYGIRPYFLPRLKEWRSSRRVPFPLDFIDGRDHRCEHIFILVKVSWTTDQVKTLRNSSKPTSPT